MFRLGHGNALHLSVSDKASLSRVKSNSLFWGKKKNLPLVLAFKRNPSTAPVPARWPVGPSSSPSWVRVITFRPFPCRVHANANACRASVGREMFALFDRQSSAEPQIHSSTLCWALPCQVVPKNPDCSYSLTLGNHSQDEFILTTSHRHDDNSSQLGANSESEQFRAAVLAVRCSTQLPNVWARCSTRIKGVS